MCHKPKTLLSKYWNFGSYNSCYYYYEQWNYCNSGKQSKKYKYTTNNLKYSNKISKKSSICKTYCFKTACTSDIWKKKLLNTFRYENQTYDKPYQNECSGFPCPEDLSHNI